MNAPDAHCALHAVPAANHALAHPPNEWVAVEKWQRCGAFVQRLVERVAPA